MGAFLNKILGKDSKAVSSRPAYPETALRYVSALIDQIALSDHTGSMFVLSSSAPPDYLPTVIGALSHYLGGADFATVEGGDDNRIRVIAFTDKKNEVSDKLKTLLIRNIARSEGMSPQQVALLNKVQGIMIDDDWHNDRPVIAATLSMDPGMLQSQQEQIIAIIKGISYTNLSTVPVCEIINGEGSRRIRFLFPQDKAAMVEKLLSAMSLQSYHNYMTVD